MAESNVVLRNCSARLYDAENNLLTNSFGYSDPVPGNIQRLKQGDATTNGLPVMEMGISNAWRIRVDLLANGEIMKEGDKVFVAECGRVSQVLGWWVLFADAIIDTGNLTSQVLPIRREVQQ
jgi:hypothetical protein